MAPRRCCVPTCTVAQGEGVPVHCFPDPRKPDQIDRFRTWVMKILGDIVSEDDLFIYKNRRVCHRHFEAIYTFPNNRLTSLAIPTLHLPGVIVPPQGQLPMQIYQQSKHPLTTLQATTAVDMQTHEAVASTSQASVISSVPMKHGVIVPPEGQLPMQIYQQSKHPLTTLQATTAVDIQTHEAVASTSQASVISSVPMKHVSRRRVLKPVSKIERELRATLAETKAKLRKFQSSKESYKARLNLANKVIKSSAFETISEKMSPAAKIFFEMQIKQFKKKPKGRRFTLEQKLLALSVYKPSPKAYKLLGEICILPKRRTLDKILQKVQLLPGLNDILFHHLKKRVDKMPKSHKLCTIIFDEMTISPHVAFDKGNDIIHGFVDNGLTRQKQFSDHVLVFMVRGVIKKYKQPIAYTLCTGTTKTIDLSNQIKNIIKKVMESGLTIISTVCDQGSTNMAALNLLMGQTKASYLRDNQTYTGGFFEVDGNKIYPIYDPPHIMKGIRNNLLTKDLEYVMDGKKKIAKWAHLEALYRRGPGYKGVRLVHKLTAQHVMPSLIPKMRVKFCTQVFSENVGVTMGFMAGIGKLPKESSDTADLLLFFDKLFDSVNGSFSQPLKGKIYRCAVTPRSPHHKLWSKSLPILKSMRYVSKNGSKGIVPSITSWIKTIEALQAITKHLQSQGLNSLLLRHFNQDPLENFFGSIRAHGLRNTMPTALSFLGSYKSILLTNLTCPHSVGANCEDDETGNLQSLKFFLVDTITVPKQDLVTIEQTHLCMPELNTNEIIFNHKEKSAAIAYCSGWLVQKIKTNIYKKCERCKSEMESTYIEDFHNFIKIKEYRPDKTWLCYPTREVFDYFCQVENMVTEILKSSCHIQRISEYVELIITMNINTNFLSCELHKNQISEFILKKSILFFVNNWCREINQILSGKTLYWDENDDIKQAAHNYCIKHRNKAK